MGMIASAEMLVMGDEVIGMVRRFVQGVEVNPETLARDVIEQVGPGGNFLMEDHTHRHFREEHWIPTLMARQSFDQWSREGKKTMGDRIRDKVRSILETHKVPRLPDSILTELDRIKREAEKELARTAGSP